MEILVVDNLSPFTPNILECLGKVGAQFNCKKFSDLDAQDVSLDLRQAKRVILSGRRKNSKENNAINSRVVRYCYNNNIPLLGICYGAEIIALTLGGTISKMSRGVQGQMMPISVARENALTGREKKSIMGYESHGYYVARLPQEFETLASSAICPHEIFSHVEKKIFGTQFHPEKSGEDGLGVISNFTLMQ